MTVNPSSSWSGAISEILGREAELDRLRVFTSRIEQGGQAMLVLGEAGIGKSALLDETARRAEADGIRVLRCGGAEFEAGISFAGLHQLLHPLLASPVRADLIGHGPLSVALGLRPGPQPEVLAISTAMLALLAQAGKQAPLLLVIDDLPWVDRMSATILGMVARRLTGIRAGILAAQRDDDLGHFDSAGIPELTLGPLDPLTSDRLLARIHPELPAPLRRRLATEAEGNPLALAELSLAASGTSPLPLSRRLSDLFTHRIAPLPSATRELLLLAALAGTGDLGSVALEDALAGLHPAEVARVIGVDPGRGLVAFRHPLARHTVIQLATVADRRRAHRILAGRTDDLLRRAWHLAEAAAEPDETVAIAVEQAARMMLERGDASACVRALTRAAELSPDDADRGRRLTDAALIAAEVTGQLASASRLLDDARQARTGTSGSLGLAVAASHVMLSGDLEIDAAHRLLVAAIRTHASDETGSAIAEALHALLMVCWIGGRTELWEPFHEAMAELADRAPLPVMLSASTFADPARTTPAVLEHLDTAIAGLHHEQDPARIARTATAAVYVDRVDGCREALWRVVEDGRQGGAVGAALHAITTLCADAWLAGRWDQADALAAEGAGLCRLHGYRRYLWNLDGYIRPLVAAARGRGTEASAAAREMTAAVAPAGTRTARVLAHHVHLMVALSRGDFEDAYRHATAISPPGELASHVPAALWTMLDLVEAATRTGRPAMAAAHAAAAQRAGIACLSPRLALIVRACAAEAASDDDVSIAQFSRAVHMPGADRWPFDLARTRLLYGERLRRTRAMTQARDQLAAARDAFAQLGAAPWVRRAEAGFRATGAKRARSSRWDNLTLTPQELEVAQLAAAGLANKEIAARLRLSPRTVSTHLYHAFPKLGVSSRAALRDALSPRLAADPYPPASKYSYTNFDTGKQDRWHFVKPSGY